MFSIYDGWAGICGTKGLRGLIPLHFCISSDCGGVEMNGRKKILIALFSALVLLVAVTLAGCFGDEEGE